MNQQPSIKSRDHANEIGQQVKSLCMKLFREDNFDYSIEDNGGVGGDGWSVVFPWCAIDTGWPVEVSDIMGSKELPGYRVWVGVMKSGGHWEPEYVDDVTLQETLNRGTAVQATLYEYVNSQWNAMCVEGS